MTVFRQKNYGKEIGGIMNAYKSYIIPTTALGISTASLYTSHKNMKNNERFRKESKADSKRQIKAMEKLSKSLLEVDKSLHNIPQPPKTEEKPKKKGFWFFRKKEFSESLDNLINKTIQGAGIGGGIGIGIGGHKKMTSDGYFDAAHNKEALKTVGISTAVGAGLGFLVGAIQNIVNKVENRPNPRLLKDIEANLKQAGLVKNTDYVLDPKYADLLKTRVSVVISKSSGDLKLAVNTFNDPKLDKATRDIIKGLPKSAIITEKFGNKFNDLSISTISSGKETDAAFISNIIGEFVSHKFPVYIVEVG